MKSKRPLTITVLCILLVVATLGFFVQDLPRVHFVQRWVFPYLVLSALLTLGCAAGMWMMRKWSVYLYACLVAQAAILGYALFGFFSLFGLSVRVVAVAVSFYYICGRSYRQAELGTAPNGGPGKQAGNSEVTEGPIENGMTSAQAKTPTEPGSSTAPRSRRWASMRLFGVGVAGAICVTLIWLLNQPEPRIQELAFTPAGSDVEAKELVQRMLRVNEPWLKPKPISASFFLHRSYHNYSLFHGYRQTEQNLGPYSVQPGCKPAFRVGSTVRTPLHEMLNQPTNYSVKMVGSAQWKGRSVVGVDVAFGNPAGCQVGLGGQGANYSLAGGPVESVRMLIDPGTAVPVLLRTSARLNIPGNPLFESWWEFGPVFFKLDEGLVPQAFDWRDNRNKIQEHQQFQILNGAWVFDQGRAVIHSGSGIRPRGLVGVVSELFVRLNNGRSEQTLRLTNFSLTTGVSVNGAAQSIIPAKKEVKP